MERLLCWVDEREPVTALAAFRVALALVVLTTLVDTWWSGAAALLWYPVEDGGLGGVQPSWRVQALGGPSVTTIRLLSVLCGLGSLCLLAGFRTRVAALVAGQAFLALASLQPGTGGGHDRLITNALWLLVLSPAGLSFSLDCWLRTRRWVDETPRPCWPRRLLCWQLVLCYGITGWQKLGPEWWPWGGLTAVYRSLLQPAWARVDLAGVLPHLFPLTQAMTALTLAWECGFPVILLWWWARRRGHPFGRWPVRAVLLGAGVLFHTTLALASNLGPFPYVTLAYYLCFLEGRRA
jgi:hypothetical protein